MNDVVDILSVLWYEWRGEEERGGEGDARGGLVGCGWCWVSGVSGEGVLIGCVDRMG